MEEALAEVDEEDSVADSPVVQEANVSVPIAAIERLIG